MVFKSSQLLIQAPNSAMLPNRSERLSLSTSPAKNATPSSRMQPHPALEKRPLPLLLLPQAPLLEVKLRQLLMLKLLLIRQLLKQRRLVRRKNMAAARLLPKRLRHMPKLKRQIQPRNLQKLPPGPLHMLLQPRQMLK